MKQINKIVDYFKSGETNKRFLGVELEHFICNADGELIDYAALSRVIKVICEKHSWKKIMDGEHIIGAECGAYTVTLEPAGQLEISINAQENIAAIEKIYDDFSEKWEKVF